MASGFPGGGGGGGGGDFYSSAGINGGGVGVGVGRGGGGGGGGSSMMNNVQYRSQLGGIFVDSSPLSSPMIQPRRTDLLAKRSLAELQLQNQHQHLQQQQQAFLMRMVKQRTQQQQQLMNRTSPISPLSPVDSEISTRYGYGLSSSSSSSQVLLGNSHQGFIGINNNHPLLQVSQQKPRLIINPPNNSYLSEPSLSNLSFSNSVHPQNSKQTQAVVVLESENESEKKMRNRLQELEKQLLDDDDFHDNDHDVHGDDEGDAASVITGNNEWTETMQNLLSPPPPPTPPVPAPSLSLPNLNNQNQKPALSHPSPTTSSSSSTSSSPTSQLSSISSKQSLVDAANAISEGRIEAAISNLDRLKPISNTKGDSEQRLTAYMVSALLSRINPIENPPPSVIQLYSSEEMMANQLVYEVSPCFKLGFMAANLAILEFTKDQPTNNVLHVLDFDIGQGHQYVTLIHAFGERLLQCKIKPSIKITTVTDPSNGNGENGLRIIGDRLKKLADRVGIGFKFNIVSRKLSDLNKDVLCIESDESLAVNFAFKLHRLPDESVSTENPRDELLRFVKGLRPKVVTLVEQELNCNTATFVARVTESCGYYRALFDSLDATMTRDSSERARVEECLARKATNSVACEGRDRVERSEVFGKWRARMGMAGFQLKPLSQNVGDLLRGRLGSFYDKDGRLSSVYRTNPGFTIKEEAGGICFGWMGKVLTVASAWC